MYEFVFLLIMLCGSARNKSTSVVYMHGMCKSYLLWVVII